MKRRHKRLGIIFVGLAALTLAAYLVMGAFRQNLVFFFSPTQVVAKEAPIERTFRVGGLVENGSLKRDPDGLTVRFTVTDTAASIPVVYKGILPDLFKEGRGCVAQGKIGADGVFRAEQVRLSGSEASRYRHVSDESGRWLELYFCARCGTNLGFTLEAVPGIRTVPAGSFDDASWLDPQRIAFRHVFTRSRRPWSDLSSHVEIFERHFRG